MSFDDGKFEYVSDVISNFLDEYFKHTIKNKSYKVEKEKIKSYLTKENINEAEQIIVNIIEADVDKDSPVITEFMKWIDYNIFLKIQNEPFDQMIETGLAYIRSIDRKGQFIISLTEEGENAKMNNNL